MRFDPPPPAQNAVYAAKWPFKPLRRHSTSSLTTPPTNFGAPGASTPVPQLNRASTGFLSRPTTPRAPGTPTDPPQPLNRTSTGSPSRSNTPLAGKTPVSTSKSSPAVQRGEPAFPVLQIVPPYRTSLSALLDPEGGEVLRKYSTHMITIRLGKVPNAKTLYRRVNAEPHAF